MPELIDPRGQDNPSTYFVEDRSSNAEMIRLMLLDSLATAGMGGPLAEQPDPASLHRVLDVGCGPGGWILEAARLYPHMALIGIDISWRLIEYARAEAQAQRLIDGVEFLVMDATKPLTFPDASFDLVNMRNASSFLSLADWPWLLRELVRVTRPGGIIRVTDCGTPQTTSPAYAQLCQMLQCAGYKAGYCLTAEEWGILPMLPQLLTESGCQNVQTTNHAVACPGGTAAGQLFYQNALYTFQMTLPLMQKMGCTTEDYDAIYQQALLDLQQNNSHAQWDFLTAWGSKPNE
jgi:ubiquinone/menaquinone biosynthesis C-methylase UbiE